jgi:hypothetical protein
VSLLPTLLLRHIVMLDQFSSNLFSKPGSLLPDTDTKTYTEVVLTLSNGVVKPDLLSLQYFYKELLRLQINCE